MAICIIITRLAYSVLGRQAANGCLGQPAMSGLEVQAQALHLGVGGMHVWKLANMDTSCIFTGLKILIE